MKKWVIPVDPKLKPMVVSHVKNEGMTISGFVEKLIKAELQKKAS